MKQAMIDGASTTNNLYHQTLQDCEIGRERGRGRGRCGVRRHGQVEEEWHCYRRARVKTRTNNRKRQYNDYKGDEMPMECGKRVIVWFVLLTLAIVLIEVDDDRLEYCSILLSQPGAPAYPQLPVSFVWSSHWSCSSSFSLPAEVHHITRPHPEPYQLAYDYHVGGRKVFVIYTN